MSFTTTTTTTTTTTAYNPRICGRISRPQSQARPTIGHKPCRLLLSPTKRPNTPSFAPLPSIARRLDLSPAPTTTTTITRPRSALSPTSQCFGEQARISASKRPRLGRQQQRQQRGPPSSLVIPSIPSLNAYSIPTVPVVAIATSRPPSPLALLALPTLLGTSFPAPPLALPSISRRAPSCAPLPPLRNAERTRLTALCATVVSTLVGHDVDDNDDGAVFRAQDRVLVARLRERLGVDDAVIRLPVALQLSAEDDMDVDGEEEDDDEVCSPSDLPPSPGPPVPEVLSLEHVVATMVLRRNNGTACRKRGRKACGTSKLR